MPCEYHTKEYYCDICSPPSRRVIDEQSSKQWYDLATGPSYLDVAIRALIVIEQGVSTPELYAKKTLDALCVVRNNLNAS